MDRFVKHLSILIIMLFILATGIDVTLDRLAGSSHAGQYTIYESRNDGVVIYTGDLSRFAEVAKSDPRLMPKYLRRVRTSGATIISADQG